MVRLFPIVGTFDYGATVSTEKCETPEEVLLSYFSHYSFDFSCEDRSMCESYTIHETQNVICKKIKIFWNNKENLLKKLPNLMKMLKNL